MTLVLEKTEKFESASKEAKKRLEEMLRKRYANLKQVKEELYEHEIERLPEGSLLHHGQFPHGCGCLYIAGDVGPVLKGNIDNLPFIINELPIFYANEVAYVDNTLVARIKVISD